MTARRTLVTVSWSLQRADHGEQPFWMGVALAAMTGSMGRPGGGFGSGYGAIHSVGLQPDRHRITALAQGANARHDADAGRAHRRRAARARAGDRLQRPAHHVPGRAPRLLVRRQSVPSPPGPEPPGARLAAARDRDRARVVVEPDRALRRHRVPGGHRARAQRRRRRLGRLLDLGDAPGGRAAARGVHRLRDALRARRAARVPRRASPRAATATSGCATSTTRRARTCAARVSSCRRYEEFWDAGRVEMPTPPAASRPRLRRTARRSGGGAAADAVGAHRDRIGHDRGLRLRRLPGPPGLDGAGRVARLGARRAASRCT